MDGDPAVESELDGFSRVLPLPYRVALIIVLGMQTTAGLFGDLLLTFNRRHLGMGSQPPLSLPDPHRCPLTHSLSFALLAAPPPAPPLLLPHRDFSLHPARALAAPILDPYTRQPKRHCGLGNPAKPIPSSTGSRFCSAAAIC